MNWKFWVKRPQIVSSLKKRELKIILDNPPDNKDLKEWRHAQCTVYFRALLQEEREDIKENIVSGLYTGDTTDKTAQLLAKAIGQCEQLEDVLYAIEHSGEEESDEVEE